MSADHNSALIAEHDARRGEETFAALVRQHVNLVFATAMRQVGDTGAAEEVTQNVFIALAQASGKLKSHPTIAGWLYRTTLNKSREWLRSELRRRRREQVAVDLQSVAAEGDSIWSPLVPLLDEALLKLHESDRLAVMMHFMEGRTFEEVGSALGVGEDTARKRVNRCLHQLTHFFHRRGFSVPALSAGAPLFALASHPAPAGLAASATKAALAAAHSAASASTLTLLKGALKIMAWTNSKTAIVVGIGLLVAAGTTTVTVKEIHDHRLDDWQNQKQWPGLQVLKQWPQQVAILPSPLSRPRSLRGAGEGDGFLGYGYPFDGMVQTIEEVDKEHVIISVPVPKGRFDWIANLSGPDGDDFSRNQGSLEALIRKKFGLQIRSQDVKTNALALTLETTNAPGLRPWNHDYQNGPVLTKRTFWGQGGTWLLVQALEDYYGGIVVDRTGLAGRYEINLKWDGTRQGLERVLRTQLGFKLSPADSPVVTRMVIVEKAGAVSVITMNQAIDVQPDGSARFRLTLKQTNRTGEPISEDYIDNIGELPINSVTDTSGQPMNFRIQPDAGKTLIVSLNNSVSPGAEFAYTVDLTITNLVQQDAEPGEFVCERHDEPSSDEITHSIEDYRLPAGAVIVSKHPDSLKATARDGRIDLRIDRTIQPGGTLDTSFRYRLAAK